MNISLGQLGIPPAVRQRVWMVRNQIVEKGAAYRVSTPLLNAAAIFIVCREMGIPKTIHEIEIATGLRQRSFGINVHRIAIRAGFRAPPRISPETYLRRYLDTAAWSISSRNVALEALRKWKVGSRFPDNHSPRVVAAGAFSFAARTVGQLYKWEDVRRITGIQEGAASRAYKDLISVVGPPKTKNR